MNDKNIAFNIVANSVVLIARILYAKHKEFGKNEVCEADAVMWLYLGYLALKQVTTTQTSDCGIKSRKVNSKAEPSTSIGSNLSNLATDFSIVFVLIWAFGSSLFL